MKRQIYNRDATYKKKSSFVLQEKLDFFYTVRGNLPEWFDHWDPFSEKTQIVLKSGYKLNKCTQIRVQIQQMYSTYADVDLYLVTICFI